ncbi:MAG: hypothetical protein B6244_12800 [Candidatus Cloacimonetes bacterium 4572_55]|nr:MAG: hypothetical protein B6244_12800 [Candidatus Cloacimonetes bacterium 4572_55]
MLEILITWIAAFFTLCIFSFLYKDNPIYKFAEHVFVGVSFGYGFVLQYYNVFLPNVWNRMPWEDGGSLFTLIPLILGLLMLTRIFPDIGWISRWPLAVMIGSYAGLQIIGNAQGDLIEQVRANFLPLWTDTFSETIGNWFLVFGTITTLVFFFFSKEHKGVIGHTARVGIWVLMISFGASFGYTVMARVSLLIGRLQFLLEDCLHLM